MSNPGEKLKYPIASTISTLESTASALKDSNNDNQLLLINQDINLLKSREVQEINNKINELNENRKTLSKANVRDKHYATGSILLGVGVGVSILGGFNTYLRAGKLFPGPHLFAGMAITGLWAAASALVPEMQKGNDTARTLHILLNCINILLFAWQVNTGIGITLKVI